MKLNFFKVLLVLCGISNATPVFELRKNRFLESSEECMLCSQIVATVEEELVSYNTTDHVISALDNACDRISADLVESCHTLVHHYGVAILDMIQHAPPKGVCLVMGMCSTAQETLSVRYYEFGQFTQKYAKRYDTKDEHLYRQTVYHMNKNIIEEHNAKTDQTYKMEMNKFGDLTNDEFKTKFIGTGKIMSKDYYKLNAQVNGGGLKGSLFMCKGQKQYDHQRGYYQNQMPESVDWREKGVVTPVKNQQKCGSCWSFSTTGAIEGAYALATGKLVSLSEQQLLDCDTNDSGCNGGLPDLAFGYARSFGLCPEDEYPYVAMDGEKCMADEDCTSGEKIRIDDCVDVVEKNEYYLMKAVAQQPVSVAIEADKVAFQFYSSGVLTSDQCGQELDHAVLTVGYGTDALYGDYWLVKNSWGATWGEKGYIRMRRRSIENDGNEGPGECGIAIQPSFPIISKSVNEVSV